MRVRNEERGLIRNFRYYLSEESGDEPKEISEYISENDGLRQARDDVRAGSRIAVTLDPPKEMWKSLTRAASFVVNHDGYNISRQEPHMVRQTVQFGLDVFKRITQVDIPKIERDSDTEGANFCFNPAAEPFNPELPTIGSQDEFIQDLFAQWDAVAFSWQGEMRSALIATWFVDHGWHWPHGTPYRLVRLWEDFTSWKHSILDAWCEHLVPGAEVEFHIVHPKPYCAEPALVAHVIVVQRPRDSWVDNQETMLEMKPKYLG